ncbi:MAG: Trm112 family protein [Gammaproteobacteria bacterium]|nr:Trm112 family protein [Gammaproteobacteria bacterium]
MTVDAKLLEILRCPVTKQTLSLMPPDKLAALNAEIERGEVRHLDGSVVERALDGALVTANGNTIYKIEDDIPIMLEDLSIPANLE